MKPSQDIDLVQVARNLDRHYLVGWKQIAKYCGVHPRTVKRWHYERYKLAFHKSHRSQQGRVIIPKYILELWMKCIG